MSQMIYGVFDTRAQADSAILAVQSQTHDDDIHAFVHEGPLRHEEMAMADTDALRGAILGAVLVGGLAALIGSLLVPSGTLSFGWSEMFFLAVAGTVFGVTAGAVAGASEPRGELVAIAQWLEEGKVLVTMNADNGLTTATILELFAQHGAVDVAAA